MSHDQPSCMTIDGRSIPGASRFDVTNPATGAAFATAPNCSSDELDSAVAAARRAFPGWAATPIEERRKALKALASLLLDNSDELKRLLTAEQGKPLLEAEGEIGAAAWYIDGFADLDLPVDLVDEGGDRLIETRHLPLGVVGAIAPWNFPLILAAFKIAPALLAGNTMLLKPSPHTPLATLRLGELAQPLLPPGVLNIVSGGDSLGPALTAHPGIDKISFTGSTATGRSVMASAAATLKRVTLELGGNDPAIVLPDVDVEAVAERLFWAAFGNAGQICLATKRLYVHRDIHAALRDALIAYAGKVNIGDGAAEGTGMGPVNNRQQFDRLRSLLADSASNAHDVHSCGSPPDGEGYFIPITFIDNPPDESRIVREEQFGPVLPILPFDTADEAVRRANAGDYGLGASVWSADPEQAIEIGRRLSAGTVWINEVQYLTPRASFGGQKQSGLGVEGGIEGLLAHTVPQTLMRPKAPAS